MTKIYAVEYAGYFNLQHENNYKAPDILNANSVGLDLAKQNAEHICKCVNLHEELMQKLDDWRFELQSLLENGGDTHRVRNSLSQIKSEIKELQSKAK